MYRIEIKSYKAVTNISESPDSLSFAKVSAHLKIK